MSGYAAFRRSIEPWSPEAVAPLCGVDAALIREAARAYGQARAAITLWGMGITQHVHGVRNARCLVNLALLTGNVGRPGTGLHPMRGQNNVQGVSDMGVLPNFLPGYAKVSDPAERSRFEQAWGAPVLAAPGVTIVEMINAAALGQIKGLYFMGENPAMSDPDAGHVREALCRLDHLVVQDIFLTETAALADVVLPATSMFEKRGSFTNTNRQVQISRPVLAPPGDAAQDLWILQEIARRLGLDWSYAHPSGVWDEVRSLWPAIEGVSWERLERDGSAQYPCSAEDRPGEDVLFAERFATPDGRAKLVPVEPVAPAEDIDESYPYVLITGRMLEHWHTGVMTRRSHLLNELEPEAFVCVNGRDLTALGASIGDALRLSSRRGIITATARLDDSLPPGTVFMPFCYAEAAANLLTNPALDPESKIPEYKFCAVSVDRSRQARRGRPGASFTEASRSKAMSKDFAQIASEISTVVGALWQGAPDAMKAFGGLASAATASKTLDTKTKELMAVAISIAVHCEGCVAFHTKKAHQNGATREELLETVALAIYMGGGPAAVYGADAVAAFDQFEGAAG